MGRKVHGDSSIGSLPKVQNLLAQVRLHGAWQKGPAARTKAELKEGMQHLDNGSLFSNRSESPLSILNIQAIGYQLKHSSWEKDSRAEGGQTC